MTDTISKLGYLAGATRFRRISEKLHLDGDKIYTIAPKQMAVLKRTEKIMMKEL